MSYLDDADHDWALDTSKTPSLIRLLAELGARNLATEDWRIILRGYAGLKARHPYASDEQCLHTSMVWYFG